MSRADGAVGAVASAGASSGASDKARHRPFRCLTLRRERKARLALCRWPDGVIASDATETNALETELAGYSGLCCTRSAAATGDQDGRMSSSAQRRRRARWNAIRCAQQDCGKLFDSLFGADSMCTQQVACETQPLV